MNNNENRIYSTSSVENEHNNENSDSSNVNIEEVVVKTPIVGIYFAIFYRSNRLAISTYSSKNQIIRYGSCSENEDFVLLKQIIYEIKPTVVLINSKASQVLIDLLIELNNMGEFSKLKFCLNCDFDYLNGKVKLMNLKIANLPKNKEKRNYILSSIIDFSDKELIQSLGGLIVFLLHCKIDELIIEENSTLKMDEELYIVRKIKPLKLENYLALDFLTLKALQVFTTNELSFKFINSYYFSNSTSSYNYKSINELSLFSFFSDKCLTIIGKNQLKIWMIRPIIDLQELNERLNIIDFFKNNEMLLTEFDKSLRGIRDFSSICKKIRTNQGIVYQDWLSLVRSCNSFIAFITKWDNLIDVNKFENLKLFQKLDSIELEPINKLLNLIEKTINFDLSQKEEMIKIHQNVNNELEELHQLYGNIPHILNKIAKEQLNEIDEKTGITELCIVYLPQIGYLASMSCQSLGIKIDSDLFDYSIFQKIDNFDFQFASNDNVYFRTKKTIELDNNLGDVYENIRDLELQIVNELVQVLREYEILFGRYKKYISKIDCLMAIAKISIENNFCKPTISNQNIIKIRKGKNILQQIYLKEKNFIPNNTRINLKNSMIQIITGPNMSGKSTYLRQVGVIVYLSHIGFFVPAESCKIGLCDRIFTRVLTEESSLNNQSSFLLDLEQVAKMIKFSTKNSLLLIDEFGKGTNSERGCSLLAAVITHFQEKGGDCPKILISTHFYEIFQYKLINNQLTSFFKMDIVTQFEENQILPKEIIFLYNLKKGLNLKSYGTFIAKLAGFPKQILERTNQIMYNLKNNIVFEPVLFKGNEIQQKKNVQLVDKFLNFDFKNENLNDFLMILENDSNNNRNVDENEKGDENPIIQDNK
ncbi:muts protein [Anaeramoeba flamelloides]|uniref:Muts protein n=1 Tax=Anaeramoeba flamelloides TaxID=1746091 RepID=A0AAV7YNU5_9EUKA|nr:muts protein [Anaeramoeba flamelloides]